MKRWQFKIPLRTERELALFVRKAWGVQIPNRQVCKDHVTPWRAFTDAYFARNDVDVWKASRGFAGKSFTLALLGLTVACTMGVDVNVLGGSGEQSERVHGYMQGFWKYENAPRGLLVSDPSKRETQLVWGNHVRTLMASSKSVRGPHPAYLLVDECDEVDIKILDAALGQPMAQMNHLGQVVKEHTVISSTHQYAQGAMTEVLKRAKDHDTWAKHQWCYRETAEPHGWLSWDVIERKRVTVTGSMWNTEFELQDPAPEARAIMVDKVAAMFDRRLGHVADQVGREYIFEQPQPGAKYITGADWARKQDFTVIITWRTDVRPIRLVAYLRIRRQPWPTMVGKFDDRVKRYGGLAYHDGTGVGDVVAGYTKVNAAGVLMVGRARADMLTNYIAAIERGDLVAPFIETMEEEHRLASVDDVYGGGQDDHLPDTIAASALGYIGGHWLPLKVQEVEGLI